MYYPNYPYAPHLLNRSSWAPLNYYVGQPGSEWTQAPTAQEQTQGYKKTDLMTLQIKIGQLRTQIDKLLKSADPSTDPAALNALKDLLVKVTQLDTDAAHLASGVPGAPFYAVLASRYGQYKATFDGFGVEQVVEPPAPAPGKTTASAPPPTTQKLAAPGAPTITKKPEAEGCRPGCGLPAPPSSPEGSCSRLA